MFGLTIPVVLAPMAHASGGRLAAAVAKAGGLGLIGGGYCDADWIDAQFDQTGSEAVGCGLITWRLAEVPGVLDRVLRRRPRAIFLSFGDPRPHAPAIKQAGVPLICQVQDMASARQAIEAGADVIVAQGSEAGGHGAHRSTLTLIPELADHLYYAAHDTLLLAAGGIADSRGLAACISMGADGAVMGTRLWASQEALVHENQVAAVLQADGDSTLRTTCIDKARGLNWPAPYTVRVMANTFTDRWHEDPDGLDAAGPDEAARWQQAWKEGDTSVGNAIVGESIGIIRSAPAGSGHSGDHRGPGRAHSGQRRAQGHLLTRHNPASGPVPLEQELVLEVLQSGHDLG